MFLCSILNLQRFKEERFKRKDFFFFKLSRYQLWCPLKHEFEYLNQKLIVLTAQLKNGHFWHCCFKWVCCSLDWLDTTVQVWWCTRRSRSQFALSLAVLYLGWRKGKIRNNGTTEIASWVNMIKIWAINLKNAILA